jgi:hypothetical protein
VIDPICAAMLTPLASRQVADNEAARTSRYAR